jgi:hypothetical protein
MCPDTLENVRFGVSGSKNVTCLRFHRYKSRNRTDTPEFTGDILCPEDFSQLDLLNYGYSEQDNQKTE